MIKSTRTEVNRLLNDFYDATYDPDLCSFNYAAGYMQSMLVEILTDLPAKKQQYYLDQIKSSMRKIKNVA